MAPVHSGGFSISYFVQRRNRTLIYVKETIPP
jgi:hypothetical protein